MKTKAIISICLALVAIAIVVTMIVTNKDTSIGADRNILGASTTPVSGGTTPVVQTNGASSNQGLAAMQRAAAGEKYLFIFFYKDDTSETRKMRGILDSAVQKTSDRAESIVIDLKNPSEKPIIDKFRVANAPMPLVLVLAPNGAITGGFPVSFNEEQLMGAFATPGMEKCLKALQESNLVLVSVQNPNTKSNESAMKGVTDFISDAQFTDKTELVTLNPADMQESKFMAMLNVDPGTDEAITVFLAPPGALIGKFKGAVSKDELVSARLAYAAQCAKSGSS